MNFSLNSVDNNSKRIRLIKISLNHIEEFHKYSLQKELYKHLEFEPFETINDTELYLKKIISRIDSGNADYRFLKLNNSEEIIGLIGMHSFNRYRKSVEYGFGISPKYHRRGLFKEISLHIIDNLFKKTNLHRIFAYTSVFNEGSINGLKKVGFNNEGRIKDFYFKKDYYFDAYIFSKINNYKKEIK